MKKKRKARIKFIEKAKLKKIILKIIYILAVFVVIYNIVFLINTTITKKEYLKIFGISFFSMDSDSMEEDINKNDLVIIREVDGNDLEINDIIAYRLNGGIRINKIINIYFDDNSGKKCYITKSNANYYPDIEKVNDGQIIGKKISNIAILGSFIQIIQSKITSLFVILILCFAFSFNKYAYQMQKERNRKNKKRKFDKYEKF